MKHKVIGWTSYDNYDILASKNISFAEINAIVDEIKKNKYLFSGWNHQESLNCAPVLNDGKKRLFSQRGWGNIMALANDEFGDYDYARYTFEQSINKEAIVRPKPYTKFSVKKFVPQPIENEHFDVEVNEGLFKIAKKKNPFYLEKTENLRYLDINDTITLHYNNESLTFWVKDININKKEVDFPKHKLINGKYKIVVTHKPFINGEQFQKLPMIIARHEAIDTFKECCKNYNFNTMLNLLDTYDINFLAESTKNRQIVSVLKVFVNDLTNYSIEFSLILELLNYIDDFEFFKEIAYRTIKTEPYIFSRFVNHYYNNGINMDEHILKLIDEKNYSNLYSNILLRAMQLKPDNKKLIKSYYELNILFSYSSFLLMIDSGLTRNLNKEDKKLLSLENYKKLSCSDIYKIINLLAYPNYNVSQDKKFPYQALNLNDSKSPFAKNIINGTLKYKEIICSNFDIENDLEEVLIFAIKKRCKNITNEYDLYEICSSYIYALDALTGFNYNLKDKAIEMYNKKHPDFVNELNKRYNGECISD